MSVIRRGEKRIQTEELIVQKTKCEDFAMIKNLNLWGCDVEDISVIRRLHNAEVLSLSMNRISSLVDLQDCKALQELYLRKNLIADVNELRYLSNLPNLKVLWMLENPCTETEDYRQKVLEYLPILQKLDNMPVTPEEREQALVRKEDIYQGRRIHFQEQEFIEERKHLGQFLPTSCPTLPLLYKGEEVLFETLSQAVSLSTWARQLTRKILRGGGSLSNILLFDRGAGRLQKVERLRQTRFSSKNNSSRLARVFAGWKDRRLRWRDRRLRQISRMNRDMKGRTRMWCALF